MFHEGLSRWLATFLFFFVAALAEPVRAAESLIVYAAASATNAIHCLLYTSPSPRD